tara:strand:+ start:384 stop:863 length:480 start_codon:yes stop_codon:yes gene_type:complete
MKDILESLRKIVEKEFANTSSSSDFLLVRSDGILVWSNLSDAEKKQELSALTSGLWYSAKSFLNYSKKISMDETLVFGTSSKGLMAQSLKINEYDYILVLIYSDELNPAKLKLKFRSVKQMIEESIYSGENRIEKVSNNLKEKPFDDITDEEVDNLFSF